MNRKLKVAVLYGGRSAEHDVSIMSGKNVMQAIDRGRYEVLPVKVGRDGVWNFEGYDIGLLPGGRGMLFGQTGELRIDVLFPVLHGPYGEDGTVQGLAEAAGVAYVGCGVASSAICMDKHLAKRLLEAAGVPVSRSMTVRKGERVSYGDLKTKLGGPVFVKPARQGSSFGVGKASDAASLESALEGAFAHDDKVLIEEFVPAREVECAVLEAPDGSLAISDPGEIVTTASHAFYTYEAKYSNDSGTVVKTPADLPMEIRQACRTLADRAFRTLECTGLARVDFFLRTDGSLLLNEVNTLPGFTDMSMYPQALAAGGLSYSRIVNTLIETGLARHARR